MKAFHLAGLITACCLAAGLVSTSSDDSREIRELARRLDKLERSQAEASQAVSRLAKSVADLERSVRSSQPPPGDLREAASREDKQDKRLADIDKRLAEVSKGVSDLQKQVAPRGDLLTAMNKKVDSRTMQLAKWFDEYNPRKNVSHHHRDEIERIR